MKIPAIVPLLAALATASATAGSAATSPASFYVVHGLPGRNVAASLSPALPVDVYIDGKYCLLSNFTFGTIAGPFNVPAASYTVAISLANPIAPCSNAAVISATVSLAAGSTSVLVATQSTSGTPTAEAYRLNTAAIASGKQRFVAIHAADAGDVDVYGGALDSAPSFAFVLKPGTVGTGTADDITRGELDVAASGLDIPPVDFVAGDRSLVLAVAVGSASTDSVQVLSKVIPDVF